jgi:hypothetical protein
LIRGCVFGGKLTALRYPEKELVSIKAKKVYSEPIRPLVSNTNANDYDVLDIADVSGKRFISTELHKSMTIQNENAMAALEVMSRFAVDPRWLVYLPPTMSPTETSTRMAISNTPTKPSPITAHKGSRKSSARKNTWFAGHSCGLQKRQGSAKTLPRYGWLVGRLLYPHRTPLL